MVNGVGRFKPAKLPPNIHKYSQTFQSFQTCVEIAIGAKNFWNVWKDWIEGQPGPPIDDFLNFSNISNSCWKGQWGREGLKLLRTSQPLPWPCLNLLKHVKHAGHFKHVLTWPVGQRMLEMLGLFPKIGTEGQPAPSTISQSSQTLQTCVDMANGAEIFWNVKNDWKYWDWGPAKPPHNFLIFSKNANISNMRWNGQRGREYLKCWECLKRMGLRTSQAPPTIS